ncbi:hypothetical protein L596_008259 [Steinernema carpocapsae]|uniref:Uncharacterized protein n=1 Tax=Steinernema carpocapsae TaxID=34508 RepID=A0A4V6A6A5_STECR|nr:hypothetical protein L596_008259 [Steinernema carpocapsae]
MNGFPSDLTLDAALDVPPVPEPPEPLFVNAVELAPLRRDLAAAAPPPQQESTTEDSGASTPKIPPDSRSDLCPSSS